MGQRKFVNILHVTIFILLCYIVQKSGLNKYFKTVLHILVDIKRIKKKLILNDFVTPS